MESGAGRSRRSRQRPEGRGHDELGRGGRQAVGGIVLTVVEFGDEGLLSPSPGDRWQKREN